MKKSIKKLWAFALSAALLVTASGCSKTDDTGSNASPSSSPKSTETSDPTASPEETGEPKPQEETYDFKGATVKVWGGSFDQLLKEDADPVYAEAQKLVEEKYNIKLQGITLEGYDGTNDVQLLLSSVASGDPAADIVTLSSPSVIGSMMNDLLLDITEWKDQFQVGKAYTDAMTWNDKCYGISYDNVGSCWVMIYDRDLISKIGMEKTPTEMFMEGKWDYESFKTYLADMKSKLPEGVYPIGSYPFHWATMAGAANGFVTLDSTGHLAYKDEAFIEAVQLYKDLQDQGLAAPPETQVNDDGTTGYVFHFQREDESIVLSRAESWQFKDIEFNYGIVPYPWGSNVTCDGDYKTLSENYKVSFPYWGGVSVMKTAPEKTGIPGDILTKIAQDFEGAANNKQWMQDAWNKEQAGEKNIVYSEKPGDPGYFTTEEDIEIYDWVHSRFAFDWGWSFDSSGLLKVWAPFRDIYGEGKETRSTLESYYNEAEAGMKDAGLSLK